MDSHKSGSCFVCNKDILDKGVLLSTEVTLHSNTPFVTKLMHLLGESFMVIILEDDKICLRCVNLINRTDKLEQDLRKTQSIIRGFLNEKYDLNEEVGFSSNNKEHKVLEDYKHDEYIITDDESSLLPMNNIASSDEQFHPNKCLDDREETSIKSENECDVRIKSEPVLNSNHCFYNNDSHEDGSNCERIVSEPLLKKPSEDDITFFEPSEDTSTSNNVNNVDSLKSEIINAESSIICKISEDETLNSSCEKELSEECNETDLSNLNKRNSHKRTRKERTVNSIKKLRPILPKVSNIEEIRTSLYILQHSNSNACNVLNEQQNFNISVKCESSEVANEVLISDKESKSNQSVLTEAEQSNPSNQTPLTGDLDSRGTVTNQPKTINSRGNKDRQNPCLFKCRFCPKTYKKRASLRHHEVAHTGNFSHYCEFCGQGFAAASLLKYHRRSHTKETRYMCEVCGKKFSFQGTYWIHRKWHDNPFPYKCEICGKPYRHTSRLAVHRRKHKGERPYKCSYCSLTFDNLQTFKRHVMLHTKQFPFKCDVCDRGFTLRFKYNNHMARKHDTIIKKPPVNPKDYKMAVHNDVEEVSIVETATSETVDVSEECEIEESQNSNFNFLIMRDCDSEVVISDDSFPNISWLT